MLLKFNAGICKILYTNCKTVFVYFYIVFFSGDVFNPSTLSIVTRGEHMIPILNKSYIAVATPGNHDFDFGLEQLVSLKSKCNFEWVLSNVIDKHTGEILAGCKSYCIIDCEGVKVGLFGIAEMEWLQTLSHISINGKIIYTKKINTRRLY